MAGASGRPPGDGWKSTREFADLAEPKISMTRASEVLLRLLRAGKMERQRAKVGGNWVNFYRPKK